MRSWLWEPLAAPWEGDCCWSRSSSGTGWVWEPMAKLLGRRARETRQGEHGLGLDSEKKRIMGERSVGEAYIREVGETLPELSIAPVNLQEVDKVVNTSGISQKTKAFLKKKFIHVTWIFIYWIMIFQFVPYRLY